LNHPLYVEGGDVEVNGCTIAQFYPFDGRRESAIGFASPLPRLWSTPRIAEWLIISIIQALPGEMPMITTSAWIRCAWA
jgi:hypothetical protein